MDKLQSESSINAGRPNDWVGGCRSEQDEQREKALERAERARLARENSEKQVDRPNEWMSGTYQATSARNLRPTPIKIDGYESPMKNNPFLNKE